MISPLFIGEIAAHLWYNRSYIITGIRDFAGNRFRYGKNPINK